MKLHMEGEPYAGPGMLRGPAVKPVGPCPKCGSESLFEEWGDVVCLPCGWRRVTGTDDAALLEELAAEMAGTKVHHRRRNPSRRGQQL